MVFLVIAGALLLATLGRSANALCQSKYTHSSPILCPVSLIRVCWNLTESELIMEVEAKVEGWASVGFMDSRLTGRADVVVGWHDQNEGKGGVLDMHIDSYSAGVHSVPQIDDEQHAKLLSSSIVTVENGENGRDNNGKYLSFSFSREYNTGDKNDMLISNMEEYGVIWATYKSASGVPKVTSGKLQSPLGNHLQNSQGNKGTWGVTLDDSVSVLTCQAYCQVLLNGCGNSQEAEHQYETEKACVYVCNEMTSEGIWNVDGTLGDVEGNSLGCRVNFAHQAENAITDEMRLDLCKSAGPSGNERCGNACDNYCGVMSVTGCFTNGLKFDGKAASEENCKSDCESAGITFANSEDTMPSYFGDSMTCRINRAYASFPLGDEDLGMDDGDFYGFRQCYQAQLDACTSAVNATLVSVATESDELSKANGCSMVCADPVTALPTCNYYCKLMATSCTGVRNQFSGDDCFEWCKDNLGKSMQPGTFADVTGDTLGCRINFAKKYAVSDQGCADSKSGGSACVASGAPTTPTKHPTWDWRHKSNEPTAAPTAERSNAGAIVAIFSGIAVMAFAFFFVRRRKRGGQLNDGSSGNGGFHKMDIHNTL